MSKKAEIRKKLEAMEVALKIPHDITLSDEDRLILVVDKVLERVEDLENE